MTILVAAALIVATTAIHTLFTSLILGGLRAAHENHRLHDTAWTRAGFLSGLVLILFLATITEAGLWAAVYVYAGVIEGFEKAMYFSVVTFTTLGYGDISLGRYWRILTSSPAAAGILIFGWSTAIIVAALQRIYRAERSGG